MNYLALLPGNVPGRDCSQFLTTINIPGHGPDQIPFLNLGSYLTVFVQAIILVAGLAAFAYLLIGGVQYLASGGDKIHVEAARNRISYAIMGLAIVVAAVALTYVMSTVFGINILGNITWPGANTIVGDYGACT